MNAPHFVKHLLASQAAIKAGDVPALRSALKAEPQLLDLNDLLIEALQQDNASSTGILQEFVAQGFIVKGVKDSSGNGPLEIAHAKNVDWVIAQGADVRDEPQALSGACRLAAMGGLSEAEKASKLISWGADVNVRTLKYDTPLSIIAFAGNNMDPQVMVDLTHQLIEAGAKLDVRFDDGTNLLLKATSKGNMRVVTALLEAGAQCDPESGQAEKIASRAIRSDEATTLRILCERGLDIETFKMDDGNASLVINCYVHDAAATLTMLLDTGRLNLDAITQSPGKDSRCANLLSSYRARQAAQSALDEIDFRSGTARP